MAYDMVETTDPATGFIEQDYMVDSQPETEWDRITRGGYFGGAVPESSRLGQAIHGTGRFFEDLGRTAKAGMDYSLGGPVRAYRYLLDPQNPAAVATPRSPEGRGGSPELVPFDYGNQIPGVVTDPRGPSPTWGVEAPTPTVALAPERDNSPEAVRDRLGFSWGKDVPLDPATGRPTTDTTVYDPFDDLPVQAHESRGGGGFYQANIEDIPWGQRPQSWKDEQLEQIKMAAAEAGLIKLQNESVDPYQVAARSRIAQATEEARRDTEVQRRQGYMDEADREMALHANATAKLEAMKKAGMPEAEYLQKKGEIDSRHTDRMQSLSTSYGLGARLSSSALYNPGV